MCGVNQYGVICNAKRRHFSVHIIMIACRNFLFELLDVGYDSFFRKLFVLAFYTAMLLFRTLLNRDIWANPLSDVIGGAICWIGYKVKSNNKPL